MSIQQKWELDVQVLVDLIDITQNAKKVVFLGTFTAGGAKYKFENRKLEILQEGKIRKMVRQVAQLSFNGPMARKKGQEVMVVTERAVFQLVKDGVELIEIARESIYRHRYLIKWILSQL